MKMVKITSRATEKKMFKRKGQFHSFALSLTHFPLHLAVFYSKRR